MSRHLPTISHKATFDEQMKYSARDDRSADAQRNGDEQSCLPNTSARLNQHARHGNRHHRMDQVHAVTHGSAVRERTYPPELHDDVIPSIQTEKKHSKRGTDSERVEKPPCR